MLVARPGRSPVMVGRAVELDRLARLVDAAGAAASTPRVALVAGEAGVGKTRLVRELVDRLAGRVPVFAGQADPGALGRPFELLLDAMSGAPDGADGDLLAAIAERDRPLDDRLADGIALVQGAAGGGPAVLVFEDLHWADSESLTLFEHLAEPECGPLTLVGTYRPDAVHRRHPVSELLPRLERRHAVSHVRLGRLSPAEVGDFLTAVDGRVPSFRVVEALHARTGGNPYFLEELLNAGDGVPPEQLVDLCLPWSLAELMRSQLDGLEARERRIVEAAAVLGQRIEFDLLAAVTGTGEDDLIDVLRSLVAAGLLLEVEQDVFTFRHALTREAVEEELLGREKRRLHRAALDTLCDEGVCDLAQVAHHAAGAGDRARLVDAARRGSAEYLDQGSTYQALQLAELGLTEADDDPTLLAVAARAAWLTGVVGDASAHNRHRLDVARAAGDGEEEVQALRLQVRLEWELGDQDELARATDELVEQLARLPDGHERGMAMAMVAMSMMLRPDVPGAVEWADRALDVAARIGDDAVRAHALVEKGSALVMTGDGREAGAELLEEAADLGERLGDDVVVARALHNLARTDSRPKDASLARRQLERMRAAAERAGFDSMAGAAHAQGLADLAEWEGDLDGALRALDDGRRSDRGYLLTSRGSWYAVHEAGLALEAGDLHAAVAIRDRLGAVAPKASWFAGLDCHIAARTGDLPAARLALGQLVELGGAPGAGTLSGYLVHDVLSACLGAGIGAAELRPLLDRVALQRHHQDPADDAARRLVAAQLDEAEGDHEGALAGYRLAAVAEQALFPSELGTAHVGAARCAIALGRLDEAKAHVGEAERLLARWRGWRVDELEGVRRRLGGGTPGSSAAGPGSLTPRELEVVALLAEGLSNADLAARLFISPKTAAVHVSNVLAKLGMASRTEVAAWAIREGVAG